MYTEALPFLTFLTAAIAQQFHQAGPPPPAAYAQQQHQQQPQHQQQQQYQGQQQQQAPGHFGGSETHNQDHIKSHLDGQVNTNQQMNEEQMRYHYFKMHDHNNDNALDGLELIQAITHYHGDNNSPNAPPPPKFQESELESITNNILRDDDYNNDGYIDYSEFVKSQAARTSGPPPTAPPK